MNWIPFFRTITMHGRFRSHLDYDVVVFMNMDDGWAKLLGMSPLPEGHHNNITPQAVDYLQTEQAR